MDSTKTRPSGGETLPSSRTAPLKPKAGLNGAPVLAMTCFGRDDRGGGESCPRTEVLGNPQSMEAASYSVVVEWAPSGHRTKGTILRGEVSGGNRGRAAHEYGRKSRRSGPEQSTQASSNGGLDCPLAGHGV